jgi:TRAP-type C4-dicarboxylate transport system substrate-binding protein
MRVSVSPENVSVLGASTKPGLVKTSASADVAAPQEDEHGRIAFKPSPRGVVAMSVHPIRTAAAAAAAIAIAVPIAGCGSSSEATKAGKSDDPVVLTMASKDSNLGYEPGIEYFVKRVVERSDGALRVKVVKGWGDGQPDAEQRVVHDVGAGRADLGWVGTRVFDTLGVPDFQALTAPMLIESYALQGALMESGIPQQMLRGLDRLDIKGLAVLAGGLRKPFAAQRPLIGPDDYRGITFSALRSSGSADALRTLGARPNDEFGVQLKVAVDGGRVQGLEKGIHVYRGLGLELSAPYGTANINLWPETAAVFANPERLDGLSARQREWLTAAAADAAARSPELADTEARDLVAVCEKGARFANASAAEVRALRQAFAPARAQLQRDPQTKAYIAQIEQLKRSAPTGEAPRLPAICRGPVTQPAPQPLAPASDGSALNGVYRVDWPEQELYKAGTTRAYATGNSGLLTLTLRDGDLKIVWADNDEPCGGTYTTNGNAISIALAVDCQGTTTGRWSLHGDLLRLSVEHATDPGDEILFGSKPWKKIA